jgi:hypothetical protein
MPITKPDAVNWCLNFINWDAGEWVHQSISFFGKHIFTLNIPPFSLRIGSWVGWALDFLIGAINGAINELWAAVQAIPSIPGILAGVFQIIREEISGVTARIAGFALSLGLDIAASAADTLRKANNALAWAAGNLMDAILASKREVMDWTHGFVDSAIAAAFLTFRWHFNILTEFGQDIIDLFKDPEEWLLKRIESMLVRFW